jgi:Uma2 family endonuclease
MEPMTRATSRPRKTPGDLEALGEGVLAELLEGEIYVSPAPGTAHQRILLDLAAAMLPAARRLGVTLLVAPVDVYLPSGDVVQPDLLAVAPGNVGTVDAQVRGVPDLLVEVVSPSSAERDRIVKRALYERNGAPEYWIVEPEDRAVQVLRLEGSRYEPAGYFTGEAVLRTALLEGFEVPVADVV